MALLIKALSKKYEIVLLRVQITVLLHLRLSCANKVDDCWTCAWHDDGGETQDSLGGTKEGSIIEDMQAIHTKG